VSGAAATLDWLAEAHARLREACRGHDGARRLFGELRPVRLEVTGETLADHAALLGRLEAFGAVAGWVQWQSAVQPFEAGWSGPPDGAGRLLAAECVDEAGASLHARWTGGGWLLVRMAETAGAPTHLRETVRRIATWRGGDGPRVLIHHRCWAITDDAGARPVLARFVGYARED